jgi:hypothetical protein
MVYLWLALDIVDLLPDQQENAVTVARFMNREDIVVRGNQDINAGVPRRLDTRSSNGVEFMS